MVESKEVKKNLIDKRLLTQRSHVPRHGKALECLRGQGKSQRSRKVLQIQQSCRVNISASIAELRL
jgi:hypothetical protein